MADAFLFMHILAGVTALGAAGAALATTKGAVWHRRAGLRATAAADMMASPAASRG